MGKFDFLFFTGVIVFGPSGVFVVAIYHLSVQMCVKALCVS